MAAMTVKRRRRWPWVVLIIVGVVAGLLMLAQDQETLKITSPVAAASPEFTDYVASLVGAPVTRFGHSADPAVLSGRLEALYG